MKILVIQNKMIGDVLASTVLCNNLKLMYPDAQIHYLIYPHTRPVVDHNPNIDKIILFEEKYRKSKVALFQFLCSIRKTRYTIVIDVYGKIESNLVVLFSGAKTKIALYRKHSHFLFTNTIQEDYSAKTVAGAAIDNRLNLLTPLRPTLLLDPKPKIYLTPTEIENGKLILEKNEIDFTKKTYMISVLGSEERKTYPKKYMAEILDFIVDKTDATLLFNYMPKQHEEVQQIIQLCSPKTLKNCKLDLKPGGIREFLSITYHCNALIGNEGGAVNMAKGLDVSTFTLFSPWIIKEAWNSFENENTNISVHLKDFRPELYQDKYEFEFAHQAMELYEQFLPELITEKLEHFLNFN